MDTTSLLPDFEQQLIDFYSLRRADILYQKFIQSIDCQTGTIDSLRSIHRFLFEDLIPDAGEIRTSESCNGNLVRYVKAAYLPVVLPFIDAMPQNSLPQMIDKYEETMLLHPFSDGNGHSLRVWLDQMIMQCFRQRIDWNSISHSDYLYALKQSAVDKRPFRKLIIDHLVPFTANTSSAFKTQDILLHYIGPADFRMEQVPTKDGYILHVSFLSEDDCFLSPERGTVSGELLFEGKIEL